VAQRSAAHGSLGRAIRAARVNRQYSQEELSHRSGLHRTYVGGLERGERNPTFEGLRKLADALDMSASDLLAEGEQLESL
jgi:transcriptional regulator with XRE-family HTH domain